MSLALIDYNLGIPASGNNPSADQPLMQTNTNNINAIIARDHIGFKLQNSGLHNQVTTIIQSGVPSTAQIGSVVTYAKTAGQSQLFANSDNGGTPNQYQLTRFIDASFTEFATNTNYPQAPAVADQFGGWTFLPGGMLLQYGIGNIAANPTPTTFKFPVPFNVAIINNPFSITISKISADVGSTGQEVRIITGSISNTQFQVRQSSGSSANKIYWMAIGV